MKESFKKVTNRINGFVERVDRWPLWVLGALLFAIVFYPFYVLGLGSVFPIHDQLDETLMSYVLTARHMGEGLSIFPEMLGGINASGMEPSAVIFLPLYKWLSPFTAFLIQYAVVWICAFLGTYLMVRELTGAIFWPLSWDPCFACCPFCRSMGSPLREFRFAFILLCAYIKRKI